MIVGHEICKDRAQLELPATALYTYITAANGIFIYAKRPGLEVMLPMVLFREPIRGLQEITPVVQLAQRVPVHLLRRMLTESRRAMPNEALFWLTYSYFQRWAMIIPEQQAGRVTVKAVQDYAPIDILMEVHSHNSMRAFFSETDNREETGFRIYAVIGKVEQEQPEISVRVGVYGHFLPVKMEWIFGNDIPFGGSNGN